MAEAFYGRFRRLRGGAGGGRCRVAAGAGAQPVRHRDAGEPAQLRRWPIMSARRRRRSTGRTRPRCWPATSRSARRRSVGQRRRSRPSEAAAHERRARILAARDAGADRDRTVSASEISATDGRARRAGPALRSGLARTGSTPSSNWCARANGLILLRADFEAAFEQTCTSRSIRSPACSPSGSRCSTARPRPRRPPPAWSATDVAFEPLVGDAIDIGEAVAQEFSLALPPFPRSPESGVESEPTAADGAPVRLPGCRGLSIATAARRETLRFRIASTTLPGFGRCTPSLLPQTAEFG